MKKCLFFVMSLLGLNLLCACSSNSDETNIVEDDFRCVNRPDSVEATLCDTKWVLVSYGNESNEVMKESKGYFYLLIFDSDGTYTGRAYGNEIWGEYNCIGEKFEIYSLGSTKVDVEGADKDNFFLYHLRDVYTYSLTDKELRLYYSEDQYFKFRAIGSIDPREKVIQYLAGRWNLVRQGEIDFKPSGIFIEIGADKKVACEYGVGLDNYHKTNTEVIEFEDDWTFEANRISGHLHFLFCGENRFLCVIEGDDYNELVLLPDEGSVYITDPTKYLIRVPVSQN